MRVSGGALCLEFGRRCRRSGPAPERLGKLTYCLHPHHVYHCLYGPFFSPPAMGYVRSGATQCAYEQFRSSSSIRTGPDGIRVASGGTRVTLGWHSGGTYVRGRGGTRVAFGWPSGGTRVTLGWHSGVRTWPGWHAGGSRLALGRHWGGTRVAHGWPSGKRRPQARATSGSFSEPAWISPEGRGQCVLTAVPDLTGILFTRSRWQT